MPRERGKRSQELPGDGRRGREGAETKARCWSRAKAERISSIEYSPETGGGGSGVVGAMVGMGMRVERLGKGEGVEGCGPMVVERAGGDVGVLDIMGRVSLDFLKL